MREPSLSDDELAYFYAQNDWRKHKANRLFPSEVILRDALIANLPNQARVLDIGCGEGRLLASLPVLYKKYGTELNKGAAQESSKKGIQILNNPLDGSSCFDAIVMVDVFEHLKDPHKHLTEIVKSLKPGGLLGIVTGNGDFRAVRQDPANYWYFRVIEHVCMWTEKYAHFAEFELGLECLSKRYCSHYHFKPVAWTKQWLQKVAFDVFQRSKFPWLRLPLSVVPYLRRARHWTERPPYWFGRDHIVIIFRKKAKKE